MGGFGGRVSRVNGTGHRGEHVAALGLLFLAFSYLDVVVARFIAFDLTLAAAAVTGLAVYLRVLGAQFRPPRGLGVVVALWLTFLIGIPAGPWGEYTSSKITSLFTLALLCAVGGVYLLRTPAARAWWVKLNVAIGIAASIAAYLLSSSQVSGSVERLAIEGGSAITTGRAAGAAFVVLVVVGLRPGGTRRVSALLSAVVLALVIVDTGSRGPLLAAVIAVLLAAMVPARGRFARVLLGASAVGVSAYLAARSDLISERVTTLGQSGENRLYFWDIAWQTAVGHPLGVGWGGLRDYLPASRDYPHNVLLEALAEASWVAGVVLVVALWIGWRRQREAARTGGTVELAMLALFVFHLLNAMVSSDLPGNRGLWVSLGAALVVGLRDRSVDRDVPLDDTLAVPDLNLPGDRSKSGRSGVLANTYRDQRRVR